jgi:hypothetical protein
MLVDLWSKLFLRKTARMGVVFEAKLITLSDLKWFILAIAHSNTQRQKDVLANVVIGSWQIIQSCSGII